MLLRESGIRIVMLTGDNPVTAEAAGRRLGLDDVQAASGLVTALEPVMPACSGTWIAHGSGLADRETVARHDRVAVPPENPAYNIRRIWLSKEEEVVHGLQNPSARQHLRNRGEKATAEARALLDRSGRIYDLMIVFGRPAEVITRVATENHCSAIVMGSRGFGRLKRLFFGSISDAVRRSASVPVTLVTSLAGEPPRLCRGGGSGLTCEGVHQGNFQP